MEKHWERIGIFIFFFSFSFKFIRFDVGMVLRLDSGVLYGVRGSF